MSVCPFDLSREKLALVSFNKTAQSLLLQSSLFAIFMGFYSLLQEWGKAERREYPV